MIQYYYQQHLKIHSCCSRIAFQWLTGIGATQDQIKRVKSPVIQLYPSYEGNTGSYLNGLNTRC